MKKLLATILAMVLIISVCPFGLFGITSSAATSNTTKFAGGAGTEDNPYLISTKDQLWLIDDYLECSFLLINDIDFETSDSQVIIAPNDANAFTGVFDGNNYTISNYKITKNYGIYGFFAKNYGEIKSLHLRNFSINSTVQQADLSVDELKEVLTSAFENRLKLGEQNARFLQCSSNLRIVGEGNSKDKSYFIKQIYLNDEALLDEKGESIDKSKKITCAFDNYIPTDGRSIALTNAEKSDVMIDGKKLRIDEVLRHQLQSADGKFEKGYTYPEYVLEETIL